MQKKFFPITQGVACQLKWTWNTIRLYEGTSSSCHRVEKLKLTEQNFENFHNDKKWVDQRVMMLEGNFPQSGCEYCENIEKTGGTSDRLTHLKIPNLYPSELDTDPLATHVTPRILEVFLDNTCNMGCIYCDESNSSQIQNENLKFGRIEIQGIEYNSQYWAKTLEFDQLTDKFFNYLDNNYGQLKKLNVLGGEPFFQTSFKRLVNFVKNNTNSTLELTIVTNLKVSKKILEEFVADMKQLLVQRKIGRLDITVSLDCFGAEQEYVRYGLDLDKFKENFELLVQHRWITLNVNSTITSLTVKTMPEMIRYFKSFLDKRKMSFSFGIVDGRPWLHPGIFGGNYFKKDFDLILQEMPNNNDWDKNRIEYMQGIANYVASCEVDTDQILQLEKFLTELDRRRNLNWHNVFPWLDNYLLCLKGSHVV